MSVYAVIDVGSNSVKLHVAHVDGRVLADLVEICGLGEGLADAGRLGQAPMERTAQAVRRFAAIASEHRAADIVAVGTQALRSASNAQDFLSLVELACSVPVEIVTGEEEARLSYLAVLHGRGRQEGALAVFDTGGGSTEFIFGEREDINRRFSLDIGSLRFTWDFCRSEPVTPEELAAMRARLSEELGDLGGPVDALVGMGGTVTSLGAVMHGMETYEPDVIQGSTLSIAEVRRQVEMFRWMTIAERARVPGLPPERARVVLAGASIVLAIMEKLPADALTISDRGLRHGLFYDRWRRAAAARTSETTSRK